MSHLVLHANWTSSSLHLWAEDPSATEVRADVPSNAMPRHPFAADAEHLRRALDPVLGDTPIEAVEIPLRLPMRGSSTGKLTPWPSPRAAHWIGQTGEEEPSVTVLEVTRVPALRVPDHAAAAVLDAIERAAENGGPPNGATPFVVADSLTFFTEAARFAAWLLVQQRFVPMLVQDAAGGVRGLWQPWLADDFVAQRAVKLLGAMPPSARAVADGLQHEAWSILEDFLVRLCDAKARTIMRVETMIDTIEGRRTASPEQPEDPHVTWLSGLLADEDAISGSGVIGPRRTELLKRVRGWVGTLDQRSADSSWRLCFKLAEPLDVPVLPGVQAPPAMLKWLLTFHLQSTDSPGTMISAQDLWALPSDGALIAGRRVEQPQELLLAEMGRAARVYRHLEEGLRQSEPTELSLSTDQAYEFLREHRQLLLEQGFGVLAPTWWDSPSARLGVRLKIDSPETPNGMPPTTGASGGPRFGLHTLVNYQWQVSIGTGMPPLSIEEFQKLATLKSPLVFINGKWVEVRPEDIKNAVEFLRANPGGQVEIGKAIRMAYGADAKSVGVPVVGIESTGWVSTIFGSTGTSEQQKNFNMPMLDAPPGFIGSLRPYQVKGLSWLAFLDRLGLGTCLADDMGLGKTIQLLAMLLHERTAERLAEHGTPGPTLLIVPMSVVGNWVRETKRFAPSIKVYVHHGVTRLDGEKLRDAVLSHDLTISTYALAHRDREQLESIAWWRVALDEAQNIKNPGTKQAQAVRSIDAARRIALTGTPIENRLSELWSIMDFLNPGLLGTVHEFRSRFALPIEKFNDAGKGKQLRGLVQPFVLRRLKTDPQVIADLPEKVETKEFCYLTPEQANLYEQTVKQMLGQAESTDGIQRRGVILAGLTKLKQICNHPAQLKSGDEETGHGGLVPSVRSGKATRIVQMLDEVVAAGGQALVFTQFRVMGEMLAAMLRHELDKEVLLLHGGTPAKERDELVQRFQKGDGTAPIFVLSLKAGGIGLNLTAANHVFHYDRWWNPAVENQATDRAFRIGQTRTVQVHKFVVAGTLEEKIDQMIEAKAGLADSVIGSGESWLTELSLSQLRDVLTLRQDAVEIGGEE